MQKNTIVKFDWLVIGLLISIAVIILIYGIKKSKPAKYPVSFYSKVTVFEFDAESKFPPFSDNKLHWLTYSPRWKKYVRFSAVLSVVSMILLIISAVALFLFFKGKEAEGLAGIILLMLVVVVGVAATQVFFWRIINTRIGIEADKLVIARFGRIIAKVKAENLVYSRYMLYANNATAGIGSAVFQFYTEKSMKYGLAPFLSRAKYVNEVQMYWHLLKSAYIPAYIYALVIAFSVVVLIFAESGLI